MFHVRSSRVLIRWRRAAARWKVEVRSFPTRHHTPPKDIGKYFSEPDEKKCTINYDTHFKKVRQHNLASVMIYVVLCHSERSPEPQILRSRFGTKDLSFEDCERTPSTLAARSLCGYKDL